MSDPGSSDPLGDIFTLFAAPIAGTLRTVEQFRRGVDEFLRGVENFNTTMENLNETTMRINTLLAEVEEPLRASIPQITRSVKAADEMMRVVSGPAMAVAPGLSKLAETLQTPAFDQLPNQLVQFNEILGEVSKRLGPLVGLAGSAPALFGGLRIPGFTAGTAPRTEPADDPANDRRLVATMRTEAPSDPTGRKAPTKKPTKKTPAKTATKATKKASTRKPRAATRSD
jgi:hypothetical protein